MELGRLAVRPEGFGIPEGVATVNPVTRHAGDQILTQAAAVHMHRSACNGWSGMLYTPAMLSAPLACSARGRSSHSTSTSLSHNPTRFAPGAACCIRSISPYLLQAFLQLGTHARSAGLHAFFHATYPSSLAVRHPSHAARLHAPDHRACGERRSAPGAGLRSRRWRAAGAARRPPGCAPGPGRAPPPSAAAGGPPPGAARAPTGRAPRRPLTCDCIRGRAARGLCSHCSWAAQASAGGTLVPGR